MSLRCRGVPDRLAKGLNLIAIMLAHERIDDGNGRRNDEARRVTNRRRRASGCLEDFFAETSLRIGEGLAVCNAAADELDNLRALGECIVMQLIRRTHSR